MDIVLCNAIGQIRSIHSTRIVYAHVLEEMTEIGFIKVSSTNY